MIYTIECPCRPDAEIEANDIIDALDEYAEKVECKNAADVLRSFPHIVIVDDDLTVWRPADIREEWDF